MGLFGCDSAGKTIDFGSGVKATDYYEMIDHMNRAAKEGRYDGVNYVTAKSAYDAYPDRFSPEAIRAHNLGS